MQDGLCVLSVAIGLVTVVAFVVLGRIVATLRSGDPTIWEREIRKLEARALRNPPARDAIVFIGSSSIRYWDSLQADMAPLEVVNCGFGGAQIHQVAFYADRLVLPFAPRAVVFYAGENDVARMLFSQGKTPTELRAAYEHFCAKLHVRLPMLSIYFVSIKPPKARLKHWPAMQAANRLIEEYCTTDARLHFIDIVPAMLDSAGNPRRDVFKWDGIHLDARGYAIWASVIKPILVASLANHTSPQLE